MTEISFRVGVQQRILPHYRGAFFNALGKACTGGVSVFAGSSRPEEAVEPLSRLSNAALVQAHNVHILRGSSYLCWQSGLLTWLNTWQPEALVLEANPRYLSSPRAVTWAHERHCALVGWGLGVPSSSGWKNSFIQGIWRQFLHQFDALITYSQQGAEQYAHLGFDSDRIFVAPNAVCSRPTWALPERPVPPAGKKAVVISVGRLQARKRMDDLIRACAGLPQLLQPDLWVVGDGPEATHLQELAAQLYPQTRFWGAVYDQELEALFRQADLFVLPGTGGLAVQQAMAYGLPVVVAEADGTQSDLVKTSNGWIIPPHDLPALARILEYALSSIPRLRAMGAASFEVVTNKVNLEAMVAAFGQALTAAANHNHRG